MSRFRFTKRGVEALKAPTSGREYHIDAGQDNLALCVTAAGTRTFYRVGRVAGRPVRIPIGKFPDTSIEEARRIVRRMNGDVAAGKDPHAERQAKRHEPRLADLWERWEVYMTAHKRSKSVGEDTRQYNTILKPLASRRLSSIDRAEIVKLHAKIGRERGRYAANRLLALLSAMFSEGQRAGLVRGENPCRGIRRFKEEKRDRWLDGDELRRFFQAVHQEPNEALRDFLLLCLLTGARKGNVQRMRWDDVDLHRGLWRIGDAKGGEVVVVPLVTPAVEILERRQQHANGRGWVFPGRSRAGHIAVSTRAWKRVCERAGLENVHLHDLRRSLGSWLTVGGTSLTIVAKALGHKSLQATEVYARLGTDTVREALETATAKMLALRPAQDEPESEQGGEAS